MTAPDQIHASVLFASARLAFDDEVDADLAGILEDQRECGRLLAKAEAHGMRPLLYRFLIGQNSICRDQERTKICSTLQEFTQWNLRKNLRMTGELVVLVRMFAGHGINIIPFKGPTLAALAYGDLGLREFADLDLLIARPDFIRAQELLIARGYQPEFQLNGRQAEVFAEACNVMAFWHAEKEILVELHWELSPKYLPFSPDPERLRERMISSQPGGQTVMTLSPEDLLVYLCAHGAKHVWEKLIWVVDVAGLIKRHSNLDWRRVYDLAARHRCERVLSLGLRLASDVAGISTPPEMDRLMESDRESARLAAKVIQRLHSDSNSRLSRSAESLFIFRLQRLWFDKIRSFARIATTPSAADWLSFPILRRAAWAYPLLRPIRLMGKLLRGE
ncbi:MAG TPA: nucleotidyltransferase family protein [Blastocatellia bacterium]|nr:nucleotidyltransferase family protein [Blastocatellia bacterium]